MDKIAEDSARAEKWNAMSLPLQMGNIGSEVSRAVKWVNKNEANSIRAAERALDLFDLTIKSQLAANRRSAVRELCRAREVFCDFIFGENEYSSTGESLIKYYDEFVLYHRTGEG